MHDLPRPGEEGEVRSYEPSEVRRSFRLLSMDVIFYLGGLAFLDSSTIMPTFLATLTSSSVFIGAIMALRPAGVFLPQMWTAHYLSNRRRHKGFLMKVASISRVAISLFALTLFLAGMRSRLLILGAFLAMYAFFWFSEGGAGVPWTDLVAKTIPERLRGRLFGLTQVLGGCLGVAAGAFAGHILSKTGPAYPINYATLFGVAALLFWASFWSLFFIREPEGHLEEHEGGFLDYARKIARMLAGHSQLKRFLLVQLLIGSMGLSLPFYILYAKKVAGIGGTDVGLLLAVQTIGSIIWSGIVGYISDHRGPKLAIIATIIAGAAAPLMAMVAGGGSLVLYAFVFFAIGGVSGSAWIGLTNYLLEIADPRERRSYIGLMNTANTPSVLFPLLGGFIVEFSSYRAVFAITALAFLSALMLAQGLKCKGGTEH